MDILHICLQNGREHTQIYVTDGAARYVTHEYKDTGIILESLLIEHAKKVRILREGNCPTEDVTADYFKLYGGTNGDRVEYNIPWAPGIGRQIHINAWSEEDEEY